MAYQITNQRDLRRTFWESFPYLIRSKRFGDYAVDTRVAFIDWIDRLQKDGTISEALAQRATL
jgi:hypothetical protein